MAALLIASILLGIALPSYQRFIQRGHRAEAVRLMLTAAACQERIRARSGAYDTTRCGENGAQYRLRFEPSDDSATLEYTLLAEPRSPRADDLCGTLTLSQAGTRGISGEPSAIAACWSGR
jgi:type IV pilus assembly protein PilE